MVQRKFYCKLESTMVENGDKPHVLERCVNRLRNTDMEKFQTMCKMHLSFLLDLSGSSLEEFMHGTDIENEPPAKVKKFAPFAWKKSKQNQTCQCNIATLNEPTVKQVLQLVEFLEKASNINQEGLFRKTGQLSRQKLLKERLYRGLPLDLESGDYSAHDCANVLKSYLGDLQEPLLLEKHYKYYIQVQDMNSIEFPSPKQAEQIRAKQVKTIQLLFLLMPPENYMLLEHVLRLLHKVAGVSENKMDSVNLGTVFAPHILCPRKVTACELHAASQNITKSISFMIENAPDLFKVPSDLAQDISTYWKEMEEGPSGNDDGQLSAFHQESTTALNTCVTFCDRKATQEASAQIDTETALAELYAHVQAMPESSRKKKLMKQFNKANGGVTPLDTSSVSKHNRAKSLGSTLKKRFLRSNKHKNVHNNSTLNSTTDSLDIDTSNEKVLANQLLFSSPLPVSNKKLPAPASPCLYSTPVKRLFNDFSTPANEQSVCIIDMGKENQSPAYAFKGRKRKATDAISLIDMSNISLTPIAEIKTTNDKDSNRKFLPKHVNTELSYSAAFLSPVQRKHLELEKAILTPRCRAPLSVFQSPILLDDSIPSSEDPCSACN